MAGTESFQRCFCLLLVLSEQQFSVQSVTTRPFTAQASRLRDLAACGVCVTHSHFKSHQMRPQLG